MAHYRVVKTCGGCPFAHARVHGGLDTARVERVCLHPNLGAGPVLIDANRPPPRWCQLKRQDTVITLTEPDLSAIDSES